jgi:hypothetical protein
MRHHIRGWITQWDVQRLQGRTTGVAFATIPPNYAESQDLNETAPPADADS